MTYLYLPNQLRGLVLVFLFSLTKKKEFILTAEYPHSVLIKIKNTLSNFFLLPFQAVTEQNRGMGIQNEKALYSQEAL